MLCRDEAIRRWAEIKAAKGNERCAECSSSDTSWVVLDYGTVVVHALQPEAREYYDLDRLYSDCPELEWREVELPPLAPMGDEPASESDAAALEA